MEKYYYHLTDPKNVPSILANGLKCNEDGDIFLFENKTILLPAEYKEYGYPTRIIVAEHIARNQVFLQKAAMLEIDANGISVELIPDNVSEITAHCQWIIKQPIIEPAYIEPFCFVDLRKKNKHK